MIPERGTPAEAAEWAYALLMIANLRDRGLLHGGTMWVDAEQAHATLKLLVAVDGVTEPPRLHAVARAMDVMDQTGGITEENRGGIVDLLIEEAEVEWPQ